MSAKLHAVAGILAISLIAAFFCTTIVSELFLSHAAVTQVKRMIAYSLLLLVPTMAAVAGSGFARAKNRNSPLLQQKKKRMRIIGLNGLLIMVPAAIFLHIKASQGEFDLLFYYVQALELIVGALQLTLLYMNFRDGLRLSGRIGLHRT